MKKFIMNNSKIFFGKREVNIATYYFEYYTKQKCNSNFLKNI